MTEYKLNVVAMIPARMGSERLPIKNLALIDGKPLISYAIRAAQESGVFDQIVINSDGEAFSKVADRYGTDFYLRPERLGSSDTKSDELVYDFMLKYPSDIVVWVNPISPLQPASEVAQVVQYFIQNSLDSLITVIDERVHCVYQGTPINYVTDELFAKTQDLIPVQSFVYSIMMWRTTCFREAFEKDGYALMSGQMGYYPVSKNSAVIIKNDQDLMMAESILRSTNPDGSYTVLYDEILKMSG